MRPRQNGITERKRHGATMDGHTILLLLFIACDVFILCVYVLVRKLFPPVKPFELNDASLEHIEHASRYANQT
jgi:hypothetical protein